MKPNVLELIGSFHQGGSERQAVQLARLLHDSGDFRVHVACLSGDGVLRADVEQLGLDPVPSFPLTTFYDRNAALQLRRFAALLRDRRIDVIHTHDFYTNIFGMAAAALARVPVRIASRRESATRPAGQRMVECAAYRLAHAVVANCEEVHRQLARKERIPRRKIVTIYNGLDLARVTVPPGAQREQLLGRLSLPAMPERRFVTIIANLHPIKDHSTFLRAARQVRCEIPDAAFLLAGEGDLRAPLQAEADRLGVGSDTFFLGRCSRIAELLAVSSVCVLSSRAEGFSNAILEYLAAARPVVATDVGGVREVVEEGKSGFLVPPGDAGAMAARIVALLRDPGRAGAMGRHGRHRIETRFSCAVQRSCTAALYHRLLAAARRTRRTVHACRCGS